MEARFAATGSDNPSARGTRRGQDPDVVICRTANDGENPPVANQPANTKAESQGVTTQETWGES